MFLFNKKQKEQEDAAKKAEVEAIREDLFSTIDKTTEHTKSTAEKTKKLNKVLGVSEIFYYSSGGRRQ